MVDGGAPEHRSATMSIKMLREHLRDQAKKFPRGREVISGGWRLPPRMVKQIRDGIAGELWRIRGLPDDVSILQGRALFDAHHEAVDQRADIIESKGEKINRG